KGWEGPWEVSVWDWQFLKQSSKAMAARFMRRVKEAELAPRSRSSLKQRKRKPQYHLQLGPRSSTERTRVSQDESGISSSTPSSTTPRSPSATRSPRSMPRTSSARERVRHLLLVEPNPANLVPDLRVERLLLD